MIPHMNSFELLYLELFDTTNSWENQENYTPTGILTVSCPKASKKKLQESC